jgi:hypothetical protein
VGFYKDREGVVHLKGAAAGGMSGTVVFQLPAGYRPATGKVVSFAAVCGCGATDSPTGDSVHLPTGEVDIYGPGMGDVTGIVRLITALSTAGNAVILDGITFRAAS